VLKWRIWGKTGAEIPVAGSGWESMCLGANYSYTAMSMGNVPEGPLLEEPLKSVTTKAILNFALPIDIITLFTYI
jgi:hypothetical protein